VKLEKPISILLRREAAVGDVIMSTSIVRELKNAYKDNAIIDVLTGVPEVYRNNPHIRYMWHVNSPPDINDYQMYINLDDAYETNPTKHYVENYHYRAFGHNLHDHSVELFSTAEDQVLVDSDLTELADKFIVVHMRNWHWGAKNISTDTWLEVFSRCFAVRTDFNIVCVGTESDLYVDHPLIFDARNIYNMQQLKYLMDHSRCFVGIDSGPYWCAAASKTHIIALLTHLRPEIILPYRKGQSDFGSDCTAIQTLEDCRGCNDNQLRPVRALNCIKDTFPCTANWNVQAITDAILKTLGD
jgi:hypothetical protein